MAGFGDDVSMSDFAPTPGGEGREAQAAVGHTSDDSVLNVQIPTIPPRTGPAAMGGGGTEGFGAGTVPSNSSKVKPIASVRVMFVVGGVFPAVRWDGVTIELRWHKWCCSTKPRSRFFEFLIFGIPPSTGTRTTVSTTISYSVFIVFVSMVPLENKQTTVQQHSSRRTDTPRPAP